MGELLLFGAFGCLLWAVLATPERAARARLSRLMTADFVVLMGRGEVLRATTLATALRLPTDLVLRLPATRGQLEVAIGERLAAATREELVASAVVADPLSPSYAADFRLLADAKG